MTVTVQPPGALQPGVHISPAVNGGVELRCVAQSGRLLGCLRVAADCYTDDTVATAYAWLQLHDRPRAPRPLELVRGGRYGGGRVGAPPTHPTRPGRGGAA